MAYTTMAQVQQMLCCEACSSGIVNDCADLNAVHPPVYKNDWSRPFRQLPDYLVSKRCGRNQEAINPAPNQELRIVLRTALGWAGQNNGIADLPCPCLSATDQRRVDGASDLRKNDADQPGPGEAQATRHEVWPIIQPVNRSQDACSRPGRNLQISAL
jgi:hypothetical protein